MGKAELKLAPTDPTRKVLSDELRKFLKDTSDNGAHEATDVYRLACDEFLAAIERRYVDEIFHSDVRKFQVALQDRGMSPRTVKNRHTSVKAFLYATKLLRLHIDKETGQLGPGLDVRTVQKMMGRNIRPAENIDIQRRVNRMTWF